VEFLVVNFDEDRGVIVNSAPGAWRTNQILMLEAGTYEIALESPQDYAPPQISFILVNTNVFQPYEIFFTQLASTPPIPPTSSS
jgi:hypothetical protein